jgi:hypothetical protein
MDPVTRCLHCGKRMVPMHSHSGRTELKCVFCDRLDDPMEMLTARQWADSPLAEPISDIAVFHVAKKAPAQDRGQS